MSAGAAGQNASVRTTLIRILADTSKSVNELKDLGTQLASATKGYLYLKHVLGGMIRAYDELDAVVRRSTDVYAKQNITLNAAIDRYGTLSTGLSGAVSVFQQLIKTQNMTEASMVRLAVQARELSSTLNKSVEDIGKMMRELKVGLGLTNMELERMSNAMGVIAAHTGTDIELMKDMAIQGGSVAKAFGGTAENAMLMASALERATGSTQGAQAIFGKFMGSIQSYGRDFAGLPAFFQRAAHEMVRAPEQAIRTLSRGFEGMTEATRRRILAAGQFTAVQLQQLENLSKEAKAVDLARAAQDNAGKGLIGLGDIYKRVLGGVGEQLKRLGENVKEIGRAFASYIAPVFASLLFVVNSLLKAFSALPDPIKGVIGLVGGLSAAYFSLNKILAVFTGPLGLKVIGYLLGEGVAAKVASGGILTLGKAALAAIPAVLSLTIALLPYIAIAAAVALTVVTLVNALGGFGNIVKKVEGYWNSFVSGFKEGFGNAGKEFMRIFDMIGALFKSFDSGTEQVAKFSQGFNDFGYVVGRVVKFAADLIKDLVFAFSYNVAWVQDIVDSLFDSSASWGDVFETIFGDAIAVMTRIFDKGKTLYNSFLEWLGLRDKPEAEKYQESSEYKNAVSRARESARAYDEQRRAAEGLAGAIAEVGREQEKITSRETEVGLAVTENRTVRVAQERSVMAPTARQVALATTIPVPYQPSANQSVEAPQSGLYRAGGNDTVPVQIVLDEYILGQALINVTRRSSAYQYGEPAGPLHGIR